MQSERVLHSDGPPKTIVCASGLRSPIELRWWALANACVTVTESLSVAAEEFRISRVDGRPDLSAALTSLVVAAVLVGSTDTVSSAPLYSGMMLIAPVLT